MINIDHITPTERLNPSIRFSCNDSRSRIALDANSSIKSSWMAQGESGWDNSISSHSLANMGLFAKMQNGFLGAAALMLLIIIVHIVTWAAERQ